MKGVAEGSAALARSFLMFFVSYFRCSFSRFCCRQAKICTREIRVHMLRLLIFEQAQLSRRGVVGESTRKLEKIAFKVAIISQCVEVETRKYTCSQMFSVRITVQNFMPIGQTVPQLWTDD